MNLLAQTGMTWTQWSLAALMICICLLMMLVILLQKGRGQGLSGAFGGGGGGGAFGAKTGDIFTWVTIAFSVFFLLIAVVNNFAFDESPKKPTVATLTSEDENSGTIDTPAGDSPENAIPVDIGDTKIDFGDETKDIPDSADQPVDEEDKPVEQNNDPSNNEPDDDDPGDHNEGQ